MLATDGLATYVGQAAGLAEDVIESDQVAALVRAFMDRRSEWTGTPGNLLEP